MPFVRMYGLKFHFKTQRQCDKFTRSVVEGDLKETNQKLEKIYKNIFYFDTDMFALFRLYVKISPRYFHVVDERTGIEWQNIDEVVFQIDVQKKLQI